ncbi:uncharacterized protein LOC142765091 [Rhipicephalus microplus]|uniref:uncharacterized protein LOC142765091 n=1 Tax=Rhipicephalus microplus TaxID=6941 RepID=UPI003F6BA376
MSVWDIEVEEVSGPWYPLERDGTPTEDAETDSEDDEKRSSSHSASDDERSRSRGSERFRRSSAPVNKRSGLLKLAHVVAPDFSRCAFEAVYVYLLSLLVDGTPSEPSALRQLLYGVDIPVAILFSAHLFIATARLVSWSVAKLRAVEDGLVSTAIFLLVLLLAALLLTACSIQFVLLTRGVKELLVRLAMTAWLSTYDSCFKYLVCLPRRRDPEDCMLPAWCQASGSNSTNSNTLDALVYDMIASSSQGQLIQMIQELQGQFLEPFVRLYAFATCAWAFSLGGAAWAAVQMLMSMYSGVVNAWHIFAHHRRRQLNGIVARMDALCTAAALRSIVHGKATPAEPIVIRALSPPSRCLLGK